MSMRGVSGADFSSMDSFSFESSNETALNQLFEKELHNLTEKEKTFIQEMPEEFLSRTNDQQQTLLHLASKHGHLELIQILSQRVSDSQKDLYSVDQDGKTPLHLSMENLATRAHYGQEPMRVITGAFINSSIESNAALFMTDREGNSLLHAILKSDGEHNLGLAMGMMLYIAKAWLKREEETSWILNKKGESPLHLAAKQPEDSFLAFNWLCAPFSEMEKVLTAIDDRGRTALHWAAETGNLGAAKVLVHHMTKEGRGLSDANGQTSFQLAEKNGHDAVAKLLTPR